ncbi:MAG: TetR/AcrR family transcriptional regulator [Deinococcota bacterium]
MERTDARQRIIQTARNLFFTDGFRTISTDHMAKAAAVSKSTFYKHFAGMDALLEAVLQAEVATFDLNVDIEIQTALDFEKALVGYGSNLLTYLNQQQMIQFAQVMFEEARLQPDTAKIFFETAYAATIKELAAIIAVGMSKKYLETSLSAAELAEQLLGMWEGFRFISAQLGLTATPFADPERWAQKGVMTLLSAYRPR